MGCREHPGAMWLLVSFEMWAAQDAVMAQLEGGEWKEPREAISILRYSHDLSDERSTVAISYHHAYFISQSIGPEAARSLADRIKQRTATPEDLETIDNLMSRALYWSNTNYEPPSPSPGRLAVLLKQEE